MFYTVHNTDTGSLLDITDVLPSATPMEFIIKGWDMERPDLYFYEWSTTSLEFVQKSNVDRQISVLQFLNRFTAPERISIKVAAKDNPALSDYMDMLYQAQFIDLSSQDLYGGLYYLAILGLIGQTRISEILS